jgi:hypothetical protein
MSIRSYQDSSRIFAAQSLSIGSVAASSTAVFGTQTYQIRLATVSPALVKYIIAEAPSVSSTVILATGTLLPPNCIEFVSVNPGQRLAATTTSVSAVLDITETCA